MQLKTKLQCDKICPAMDRLAGFNGGFGKYLIVFKKYHLVTMNK